jgi:hypothetical protein
MSMAYWLYQDGGQLSAFSKKKAAWQEATRMKGGRRWPVT